MGFSGWCHWHFFLDNLLYDSAESRLLDASDKISSSGSIVELKSDSAASWSLGVSFLGVLALSALQVEGFPVVTGDA